MIHDCVYAHRLPRKCIDDYHYFTPSVTIKIRGEEVTGAMMCCMDDYCNQMEDPVFSIVRLRDDSNDVMKESWPILVFVLVVVAGLMPLIMGAIHDRQRRSQVMAEEPSKLPDDENTLKVQEYPMNVSAKFSSLHEMNDVLRRLKKKYRHNPNQHVIAASIVMCFLNASIVEGDAVIYNDIFLFQQDDTTTKSVLRTKAGYEPVPTGSRFSKKRFQPVPV